MTETQKKISETRKQINEAIRAITKGENMTAIYALIDARKNINDIYTEFVEIPF